MRRLDKTIKILLTVFALTSFVYFLISYSSSESFHIPKVLSAFFTIVLLLGTALSLVELTTGAIQKFSSIDQKVKLTTSKRKIINGLIGLMIVASVWFSINILQIFFGVDLPAFTPKHFRTNIFTGRCDYGGSSNYVDSDPWYYEPDCSLKKKIQTAKNKGFYYSRLNECRQYCSAKEKNYFCNTYFITVSDAWGNGPDNLLCTEIMDCPQIDCIRHKQDRQSQREEGF